jgi:mannosyltransferase OCH1-like enzyme
VDKIIHQIWIGPYDMPVRERYFTRDVKLKNPSWQYILWTNTNLPELPDNIKAIYDQFGKHKEYTFQADILRLFVIKEYGGLYLDVDFEPLGSFDDIAEMDSFFCKWNNLILNGVFGASKNHPTIIDAMNQLDINTTWYGPSWFTKVISGHDINVTDFEKFEKHYAKHHALNSWGNNI